MRCTRPGSCVAVGSYYDGQGRIQAMIITEARGKWGRGAEVRLPANVAADQVGPPAGAAAGAAHYTLLTAVACANGGTCTVVGGYHDGSGFSRAMAAVRS